MIATHCLCLLALTPMLVMGAGSFERHEAERTGVDYHNPLLPDHAQAYLYDSPFGCGGVAVGDVNGDGRPDLFFTNGPSANALYLNQGDWRFERVAIGGDGNPWSAGATMVDIDADGDLDLYVCNYLSPNELWLNDGRGGFGEEVAEDWGLAVVGASLMASFCDEDRDGHLDVFLQMHRNYYPKRRYEGPLTVEVDGERRVAPGMEPWFALQDLGAKEQTVGPFGQENRLLRQVRGEDGKRRFVDVSAAAGIRGYGHSLSAVWWDYDRDGWMDLYVANDFADPDRLYHNRGDGTYEVVTERVLPGVPWFSMGAAVADVNNDGRFDLFATDMAATTHLKAKVAMGSMASRQWLLENGRPRQAMRNHFFVDSGGERFLEVAHQAGLAATDWSWTPCFADFDQDGRVDLFVSNGMARFFSDADSPTVHQSFAHQGWESLREDPPMKEENLAYVNRGGLQFEDVSADWGLRRSSMSFASVAADLDGDGDLDLVTTDLGEAVGLYENQLETGHWLQVRLRGREGNPAGLGALVTLKDQHGGQQVRQMVPVSGFLSCGEAVLHFGLGGEEVASLEVRWPSGLVSRVEGVEAGRVVDIEESGAVAPVSAGSIPSIFAPVKNREGLDFGHRERIFDDYALQPMLPGRLSQFGPGMAVGDVDGDGWEDVYLGGAAGQAGALFLWREGGFIRRAGPWEAEVEGEDQDAVMIDADGDGDLDLVVVRGSVEQDRSDPALGDVVYRNEGGGRFVLEAGAFPPFFENAGVVAVTDWNGDGLPDLFVGSRVMRGSYPLSPPSRLLCNRSGPEGIRFDDVTEKAGPGLRRVGMVTGAVWASLDGDEVAELVLSLEWGGLVVFKWEEGVLVPVPTTMEGERGWWGGLVAADVDGDGDQDLLGLNAGWNTKYGRPHPKKPAVVYFGPMEIGGEARIVEAKRGEGGWLPVRGRSCSAGGLPMLTNIFRDYRSFAEASLEEIYTDRHLAEAQRFEAVRLGSGVFLNEGGQRFRFVAFPAVAQMAPINDAVTGDWTGDGHMDLLLVQGFGGREPETGLWHGSPGVLLAGDGEGGFRAMDAAESGFLVPGSGRRIRVVRTSAGPRVLAVCNGAGVLVFGVNPARGGKE